MESDIFCHKETSGNRCLDFYNLLLVTFPMLEKLSTESMGNGSITYLNLPKCYPRAENDLALDISKDINTKNKEMNG